MTKMVKNQLRTKTESVKNIKSGLILAFCLVFCPTSTRVQVVICGENGEKTLSETIKNTFFALFYQTGTKMDLFFTPWNSHGTFEDFGWFRKKWEKSENRVFKEIVKNHSGTVKNMKKWQNVQKSWFRHLQDPLKNLKKPLWTRRILGRTWRKPNSTMPFWLVIAPTFA